MDIMNKTQSSLSSLHSYNNNNAAANKVDNLLCKISRIHDQLVKFRTENIRRPSINHKSLRKELKILNAELKKAKRALHKFEAIKLAARAIGQESVNIMLNKTKCEI